MGISIVKSRWVPENRFPPVRQTIPKCTDAICWYVDGDHSANVSYEYEGVLKVIRRSRATLIFPMDVHMVKPRCVSEVRFHPVIQNIPGGIDAISWYVHGDHSANVSYKYEGVLKVIRRSRATLIFSVGVPMVKPHGSQRTGFLLLGRPSLEAQTPSPGMFMGIIVRMCPTNMRGSEGY